MDDNRQQMIAQIKALKELQRRRAKRTFHDFLQYVNPKYEMKWYHRLIADYCQMLFEGVVPKLMVTCPPQHGKSEIVSRLFPAWALGVEPELKMVGCSYSATLSGGFNRAIQRVIGGDEYKALFPDTFLNDERLAKYRGYICNAEMFETVGHGGFYKSVGVGGSLTGTPADIAIIDDPVKDAMEANSPVSRDNVWEWYTSVLSTRLHKDSKQLLVMTRWHEDDLIGRLEKSGEKIIELVSLSQLDDVPKDAWLQINFPAIKVGAPTEVDPREEGEALWPERHSLNDLLAAKALDPVQFECLYQGNPSSAEAIKAGHETLRLMATKAQRCFGVGFKNVGYMGACLRDNESYKRESVFATEVLWKPVFEPDAQMLSAIGDGVLKLNQAMQTPSYIDENRMRRLTGIE